MLKLTSKGINAASTSFGVVGVLQNANEMYQEGEWNWQDVGQIALGVALMTPGVGGGLLLAGGITLFAWELIEFLNEEDGED